MRFEKSKFVWITAIVVAVLSVVPFLFALSITPAGSRYVGFQYNTDDHMVYAAWMRQAMDGRFLFDNRFAIDSQPSLTIHVYFWALGLLAKVTGIPWAAAIGRFVFGGLFVLLLARFLSLVTSDGNVRKLALTLTCFGAGIGYIVWQNLGVDFLTASQSPLKDILLGHLPNDVWQPEAFVFPSLLTNSLFSVSLCLIIGIFYCVIRSRDSWKPVPYGAVGMLLLMNIHSYDVLLIALVLVGLLVTAIVRKDISVQWVLRVVVIGLGAIPAALWFLYVLRHDPVFQSRAATETYTENFRSILAGYILLMLLATAAAGLKIRSNPSESPAQWGLWLAGNLALLGLFIAAGSHTGGYWFGLAGWLFAYGGSLVFVALFARPNPAANLIISWALVGLIAPYFPGLFERKLMMGLSVPWAIMAGVGLAMAVQKLKRQERWLVAALATIIVCGTSFRWFGREFSLIVANDSNTTVEPVFLTDEESKIIDYLNDHDQGQRKVVLAMPGIAASTEQLMTPFFPEMNPIISGFTGAYTYAGHWSETPDYIHRRSLATGFFYALKPKQPMAPSQRAQLVQQIKADYILAPVPAYFPAKLNLNVNDVRDMGQVVVSGKQMMLIKITS